ncbi:hypothetical protein [Glaesserella sp.]|uniref:hypothetical protein n=1 Tax=Glaesserella sp. TaxID=2094731 RepID=UPI0035A01B86
MNIRKSFYASGVALALFGLFCSPNTSANTTVSTESQGNAKTTLSVEELVAAEQALIGEHLFSLQWISWEHFGVANIRKGEQGLEIEAEQALDGNFVVLTGHIEIIDSKSFNFTGDIVTRVSYLNNGQTCQRSGTFEFKVVGSRKYWRMQQMDSPCDKVVDYIDIFFLDV